MTNIYYDTRRIEKAVARGEHRGVVGGLWDEMGALQLDFLLARGLQPHHRLLDVGCGSLRLGRLAVDRLELGHYFGTDLSPALLDAGHAAELNDAQRARLPRQNLIATGDFDFSPLPAPIDMAIAQSVFTHLPLNHLRRCLIRLAPHMTVGGRFFVTFFECPDDRPITDDVQQGGSVGGITTTDHRDPFHYRMSDLAFAAAEAPWTVARIGDWGHPRGQLMAVFTRTGG